MNEVRRLRIKCEMEQLATLRERVHKIRDDEDRAIAGGVGGSQDASRFTHSSARSSLARS